MQSGWCARLFFAIVAALAVGGIVGGTACTRWGQPGPVPPSFAPLTSLYVDANTGSDTSGNGSMAKPYKSLTKAVSVLTSAKVVSSSGVTIFLASGNYDTANGEVFPIIVPRSVTLTGSNYGSGPRSGSFVDGVGEDTIFERLVHAPPHSAYTTLQVLPPASVTIGGLYIGASRLSLPRSNAFYAALDDIGTVTSTNAGFSTAILSSLRNAGGVLVPSGSLTCMSCQIRGNAFGIESLTVALPSSSPSPDPSPSGTSSPSSVGPSVTLSRGIGDSTVSARIVDVITDGSANVTASDETFERAIYSYSDGLSPVVSGAFPGAVDFGGGAAASSGGNTFIGARATEIFIARAAETVSALDNTWNPGTQGANRNGQYKRVIHFAAGARGKNVTIRGSALGSTVTVGPAPVPTPTPSTSPSTSPTSSPT